MTRQNISFADIKKNRYSLFGIAAAVMVALVLWLVWINPLVSKKEEVQAQVNQQQELVQKYQEKLKEAEKIREELAKKELELKEWKKKLYSGNDPYQLAARIGELLASKGSQKLDMKTYQVIANKEYGLYQEVHLRFNFMTNIEGLYFFLDQVKNFPAAILVQEINVQQIQRKTGPDLVVNVILAALMEKGEKA